MRARAARAGCGSLEAMDAPFLIDRMPYPPGSCSFVLYCKVQGSRFQVVELCRRQV